MNTSVKSLFISIDKYENNSRLINHINTALKIGWDISVLSTTIIENVNTVSDSDIMHFPVYLKEKRGILKFLKFNLFVFRHLIKNSYDVIYARGIWSFPGLFFILTFKKTKFIFDAHEYFAGLEVLKKSWAKRLIWLSAEKAVSRYTNALLTVSDPILLKYKQLYPKIESFALIRNLPTKNKISDRKNSDFIFPKTIPVILFHGYFMPSRGLENLILAMGAINSALLILIGEGVLFESLKTIVRENSLEQKILFKPLAPKDQLVTIISQATIGISLLEPVSENHSFALPNKYFQYLAAGLPVLVSKDSTLESYVEKYKTGLSANPQDQSDIAEKLNYMLSKPEKLKTWAENSKKAAKELNWENEEKKLTSIFQEIGETN